MNPGLLGISLGSGGASDKIRRRKPFKLSESGVQGVRLGLIRPQIMADAPRTMATTNANAGSASQQRCNTASNGSILVYVSGDSAGAATTAGCRTSPDGITWTSRTMATSAIWTCVVWTGTRFLATSTTNITNVSTDGITWSTNPNISVNNPVVVLFKGKLYLYDVTSTTTYYESSDHGTSWTPRSYPTTIGGGLFRSAIVSANTMMAYQSNSGVLPWVTQDGINWTQATGAVSPLGGTTKACIRDDGVGIQVVDSGFALLVLRTTDGGYTWTTVGPIAPYEALPFQYFNGDGNNWHGTDWGHRSFMTASVVTPHGMPVVMRGQRFFLVVSVTVNVASANAIQMLIHSADGISWEIEPGMWRNTTATDTDTVTPVWHEAIGAWHLTIRESTTPATVRSAIINPAFEDLVYDYTL